jgi:uncharacterized membrane protein
MRVTALLIISAAVVVAALAALAAVLVPALRDLRSTRVETERAMRRVREKGEPAIAELHLLLESLHAISGAVRDERSSMKTLLEEIGRTRENFRALRNLTAIFGLLREVFGAPLGMRVIPLLLQTNLLRKGG